MNRIRRKALRDIINVLEELKSFIEELQAEEEEYRDNIPENLQSSERYENADIACGYLYDAACCLDEAISNIDSAIE